MAFFRFSRDKRGYENFYLVQPTTRRGKSRTRVLYWFRSPPGVRVGRQPFDDAVRRALEKQYPDISFDWKTIVETPIPSADAEKWRERRRTERALKQAASEDDAAEAATAETDGHAEEPVEPDVLSVPSSAAPVSDAPQGASAAAPPSDAARRKRRRRRGGRRSEPGGESPSRDGATPSGPEAPAARPEPVGD